MIKKFKDWLDKPSGVTTIEWMSGYDYELSNADNLTINIVMGIEIATVVGFILYAIFH